MAVDNGNTSYDLYDAQDRRVVHATPSLIQRFEYNALGQLTEIWYNEEQNEHITRYYADGRTIGYWDSKGDLNTAALHFQLQDFVGTVVNRTNDVGQVEGVYASFPFGESQVASGTDDDSDHFALLDHNSDSNTDHATFRSYGSTAGRWMSPDPYDGSYDITNPQTLNRYTYTLNSPLTYVDPDGTTYDGHWELHNGEAYWVVNNYGVSADELMGNEGGIAASIGAPNEIAINMPNLASSTFTPGGFTTDPLSGLSCAADPACSGHQSTIVVNDPSGSTACSLDPNCGQSASAFQAFSYQATYSGMLPIFQASLGPSTGPTAKDYRCSALRSEYEQLRNAGVNLSSSFLKVLDGCE